MNPPVPDDFKVRVLAFAERAMKIKNLVHNEEATKVSLVLPFIHLLGYDDRDPSEVAAEHAADFSEKYRNRVDYAIMIGAKPIIAIECKTPGNGRKDDRGQLKAYFNAAPTVKLGILTDGIIYECFVDSDDPNMMDDEPFLTVNFATIAGGELPETILDGLYALTKGTFNPDTIGENARRSITYGLFSKYLSEQFAEPTVEFTRFLLKENNIRHVRASAIDGYRLIAKAAFKDVFNSHILKRLDIGTANTKTAANADVLPSASAPDSPPVAQQDDAPSAEESTLFELIRRRLAFACGGDMALFERIETIQFRSYRGKTVVFVDKERRGRLLEIYGARSGKPRFVVTDGGEAADAEDLGALDTRLFALFRKRIEEQRQ